MKQGDPIRRLNEVADSVGNPPSEMHTLAGRPCSEAEAILWLKPWAGRRKCFPNTKLLGSEIDLAIITTGRRLVEVEIKLSEANWLMDAAKKKWRHENRKYVAAFYYAILPGMERKIPHFVPGAAGIILLGTGRPYVFRPARVARSEPLSEQQIASLHEGMLEKFWLERSARFNRIHCDRSAAIEAVSESRKISWLTRPFWHGLNRVREGRARLWLAAMDDVRELLESKLSKSNNQADRKLAEEIAAKRAAEVRAIQALAAE